MKKNVAKVIISANVMYAIVVALGGFIFGFDASVISGVISFVANEFQLSTWQQGFVVSSPTLGAVLGASIAGPAADAFGRKKVLLTISLLYVVSAIFSAFAVDYYMLVSARFIGGLAFASLVLAPMYIAEISPSHLRGKMISINQFNIVIGFSVAYFANYFLLQLSHSTDEFIVNLGITEHVWRWMLGLEILPSLGYFFLLMLIPESPRWLIGNNQIEKGTKVLAKLFPTQNQQQLVDEIQQHQGETSPNILVRLKELFSPKMRLVLIVGLVVGISQQITGVNAVYFYAPSIFEQSGVGQDAAFSQAVWVGIINVLFTIVAMLLIDKLGRKPLLLIGLAGVAISMTVAAYGFSQATYQLSTESVSSLSSQTLKNQLSPVIGTTYQSDIEFKNAMIKLLGEQEARTQQAKLMKAAAKMDPLLILFGILGFVASFAVSLGPVMWVLLAEIFPNHLRGIGIAFTGLINSAVSFTVQLMFPWELATIGTAATFLAYGAFALVSLVLVYRLLPETKGQTLEQVQDVFQAKQVSS